MTDTVHDHFRNTGFTLVEILVALTLFSLILVMVFNGLYSAGLSWKKGLDQDDINDYQRLDLAFLRRQLSQAVPLVMIDGNEDTVLFKGSHNSIRFISDLPSHRGNGGLMMIDVRIKQQDKDKDLILTYQPIRPGTDFFGERKSEAADTLVLLKNIERIKFSYYGKQKFNEASAWHDNWESSDLLPDLVKLEIVPDNNRQYWPDMVVPIYNRGLKGQPQLMLYAGTSPAASR